MDEVLGYGNNHVGHPASRWLQAPSNSGKDISVLTAMAIELDKKTAGAVPNLSVLDILAIAIAYKNAG